MAAFAKLAGKLLVIVLLGGFFGTILVRLAPGFGVTEDELDTRLNAESVQAIRQGHALEKNPTAFYLHYLRQLLHGDLGSSRTLQQPVFQLLKERFPETLKGMTTGLIIGWGFGLPFAIAVVMSRAWCIDLLGNLAAGVLLCLPAAALAILVVIARAPARLVLAAIVFPYVFRYSRNLLERSASLPHVLSARARGLENTRVLLWHILPTAAPQLLSLAGITISLAFAAAIPVEALCDLPGIGQLAWKAALGRDVSLLVNLTMIVTLVTVVANAIPDLVGHSFRAAKA